PLTVTLDLTGVTPGTLARLHFDLIGFGAVESSVTVQRFRLTGPAHNQPPEAHADAYEVDQRATLTVPAARVLANDTDPDNDTLHAVVATGPAHGTLDLRDDGSFTYVPDPLFSGTDRFTYQANDGAEDSEPATVTLTVHFVNAAPSFTTGADQTVDEDA